MSADPYDLERFVQAQAAEYDRAISELRAGKKRSHWMWYVFPQIEGLGQSSMSRRYSIKSAAEAKAYLDYPVLGGRLRECFEVVNNIHESSAHDIFGSPDDMKFHSCATLFAYVSGGGVFQQALDKFFDGEQDQLTLRLVQKP